MHKRLITIFCGLVVMMSALFVRIFYLSANDILKNVAFTQSLYTVDVGSYRGTVFDCNLVPLVNALKKTKAAIMPTAESINTLASEIDLYKDRDLLKKAESGKPFIIDWNKEKIYASGIDLFEIPERYEENQPACHIIGHLGGDGNGAYGIEKVLDEKITEMGDKIEITYQVNAEGMALKATVPQISHSNVDGTKGGVVLTLDKNIQKIAEESAAGIIGKGAVVVMDIKNGDIKASVSLPAFNPNELTSAQKSLDEPFVNRAFASYSVGSTFKLAVATAAIEYQVPTDYIYECVGHIDVGGVNFNCHWTIGHGFIDLRKALEISCNPYFINLGQSVGAAKLLQMASLMGFGKADVLYSGYKTNTGSLPTDEILKNPAALANFSFGQGELTATPIQIAKMVSAIANGGSAVSANIIEGIFDGEKINTDGFKKIAPIRIMSEDTSAEMREYMISVVENGSGDSAKPVSYGAGGKTASAQTGRYTDTEQKNEIVHAWFCGFFPAETPKYAVAVLNENGQSGSDAAGPVFKKIADAVNALEGRFPVAEKVDEAPKVKTEIIEEAVPRNSVEDNESEDE